jgi:23S rRNA G2069 N7-methylase RlmK/C1962 C5-methylase RlmI
MFEVYLRRKFDSLQNWIHQNKIEAYRLYDRELSTYPLSIDIYGNFFHIYLYEKKGVQINKLINDTEESLKVLFPNLIESNIYYKIRRKQKDGSQYEKLDQRKKRIIIQENNTSYFINLTDYLDTGIFLDHRSTREIFSKLVIGKKRVLNLFSYTSAFSIVAAKAGVEYTTSVDMSNTYCNWARENIKLNNLDAFKHIVIRDNVFFFLENIKTKNWKFDFIVIDPPTMSRSKKMLSKFDIQRDYPYLINTSSQYLTENGMILFSTNFRKFKFEHDKIVLKKVEDLSADSIPLDFKDPLIHKVYLIKK